MMRMTAMAALLVVTACFLKPKKKESSKGEPGVHLLSKSDVSISRTGGGDIALVQFFTKEEAYCSISYFTTDGGKPAKESPGKADCPSTPKKQHAIRIDKIQPDSLYTFQITVWKKGSKRQTVTVIESDTDGRGGNVTPSGEYQSVIVVRLNAPRNTAEVHRHKLAKSTPGGEIRSHLSYSTGCKQGEMPTRPFRDANAEIAIKSLQTLDYASALAFTHPADTKRLLLNLNTPNEGMDSWVFSFQEEDGSDSKVEARPGSRLQGLEIESTASKTLAESELAPSGEALEVDPTKDLLVSWHLEANPISNSAVTVLIGRAQFSKAIHCTFTASKLQGTIPSQMLRELPEGSYIVLAQLESTQFRANSGWIIASYDWRTGRIQR